jgi:hypothetical protein
VTKSGLSAAIRSGGQIGNAFIAGVLVISTAAVIAVSRSRQQTVAVSYEITEVSSILAIETPRLAVTGNVRLPQQLRIFSASLPDWEILAITRPVSLDRKHDRWRRLDYRRRGVMVSENLKHAPASIRQVQFRNSHRCGHFDQ